MNEEQKNIETCLAENILSEVANVPTDPQFRSLVEESFDPLQQQALQQAGYDGYKEVVMYHQPYTFTSAVAQMKSNLILLLRRLWRFPFGMGTTASSAAGSASASAAGSSAASNAAPIRSLADMWQHYITRLKGNPEYGIPSRLSQLTDLPSAPALLADRKIGGVPEAADGISLVQLMGTAHSEITELTDSTSGWVMKQNINWSIFPNIKKVTLGCKNIYNMELSQAEEYYFPNLEVLDNTLTGWGTSTNIFIGNTIKKISMPALKKLKCVNMNGEGFFRQLKGSCEILLPNCEVVDSSPYNPCTFSQCHGVTKIVLGKLTTAINLFPTIGSYGGNQLYNLIHFEIGAGTAISLDMKGWSPTNALADADKTATFLLNFRAFIALRLANRKSTTALTITLSAAVYTALTSETRTLADLGITAAELTDAEKAAGITTDTAYNSWLDTYRAAINWNFAQA